MAVCMKIQERTAAASKLPDFIVSRTDGNGRVVKAGLTLVNAWQGSHATVLHCIVTIIITTVCVVGMILSCVAIIYK